MLLGELWLGKTFNTQEKEEKDLLIVLKKYKCEMLFILENTNDVLRISTFWVGPKIKMPVLY